SLSRKRSLSTPLPRDPPPPPSSPDGPPPGGSPGPSSCPAGPPCWPAGPPTGMFAFVSSSLGAVPAVSASPVVRSVLASSACPPWDGAAPAHTGQFHIEVPGQHGELLLIRVVPEVVVVPRPVHGVGVGQQLLCGEVLGERFDIDMVIEFLGEFLVVGVGDEVEQVHHWIEV